MSIWKNRSVELRIRETLASVPESEHRFGRPFLSAYQIAIAFDQRYRPAGRRSLRPESPSYQKRQGSGMARLPPCSSKLRFVLRRYTGRTCSGRSGTNGSADWIGPGFAGSAGRRASRTWIAGAPATVEGKMGVACPFGWYCSTA